MKILGISRIGNIILDAFVAIALAAVFALTSGCSKSETESEGAAVKVAVEGDAVTVVPRGQSVEVYFTVSPADTDFRYSNGNYNVRLCYASSKASVAEVYVSETSPVGNGRYKARITDRSDGKSYRIDVCMSIIADKGAHYSEPFCIQNSEQKSGISAVRFLKRDNPQLDKDIFCDYDPATATFTARSAKLKPELVDASRLVASFVAEGDVTVGGKSQESGVTPNDYSQPLRYVSTAADGNKSEYTVKFVNFTGLPVVYVSSSTRRTPIDADITSKTDWKAASIRIDGNGVFDDLPATDMQLRGRGNITWGWRKKPFNMKFETRTEILGMPKHKRWIMLANYADITMLRNDVSFHVSGLTSLAWAPRGEFVELVYNGQYSGTYYLVEQVRIDKNRVAIDEMKPEDSDITGGYLVEMDFHDDTTPYQWKPLVACRQNGIYIVKSPDEDDLTEAQYNYIHDYIRNFEKAITSNKLSDPTEGYKKYIEPLSFVDYWLIYEVCINHEIWNPGSVYVHKDRGGKLVAGPIWDFDYGTFNFTYGEAAPAAYSLYVKDAIWYAHLFRDPEMKALAKRRWAELKPRLQREIPEYIRKKAEYLRYAAQENLKQWPMTVDTNGDANLTYDKAVEKMITVWETRLNIIEGCMASW